MNLKQFKEDFPREPRLAKAEELLSEMREKYAEELYQIAEFYERTQKPQAACVYYKTILVKYPNTQCAIKSKKHLIAHNESLPSDAATEEDVLVEKKEVPSSDDAK
jgi:outer membrane protein assembly factor BamD (BamD/ComL family)